MRPILTISILPVIGVVLTAHSVTSSTSTAAEPAVSTLVHAGNNGRLVYRDYDDRGDRIPDFSNCGYAGGGKPLPRVAEAIRIEPVSGSPDDRARIQEAIDTLAKRQPRPDGFRGAIVLTRGTYRVSEPIRISASGIVLRGEGTDAQGTTLVATGRTVYPLINVSGRSPAREVAGSRRRVTDVYVPVGSHRLTVQDASGFKPGDHVLVIRHGNAAWIHAIGMDRITPRPGNPRSTRQWSPFDLSFDRVITQVEGNLLTIDAPITCAIEGRWGGGEVCLADDSGRIREVGIESLHAESEFDRSRTERLRNAVYFADEQHVSYLVAFDNIASGWVRNVSTRYFAHGIAEIGRGAKWITVQDAIAIDPVSLLTGGRRYTYKIAGQLNLVQRCLARGARHAFVFDARVEGPNVFLDCKAEDNFATSEPHHRWSVGGLYDRVDAPLAIQDRQYLGSGHGWAGANYVAWNCDGSLVCQQPPTAQNFAIGFVGTKAKSAFSRPDGFWESFGRHVTPSSLYRAQLTDRLGPSALEALAP